MTAETYNNLHNANTPNHSPESGTTHASDPLFQKMLGDAMKEEQEMNEIFSLLGWGDLPLELKMTIHSDVSGYLNELQGRYSTSCSYVQKRRERVDYWVNSYLDGLSTLKQSVDALKIGV